MRRQFLFLIFTSFLLVNACGPAAPSESEKLRAEVIAVHDEVMPQMGQLKSLERKAVEKVEELQNQDPVDSVAIEEHKALAYDLNLAYEGMFDWMHQYEPEDGELSDEELKTYLDGQMDLIAKVNKDVKGAIAKADKLLK
ncbi:hypothetical protein J2X69_001344 [Algoriphagus sp. 4150]|uniref:hypothetical protein n=1 Tax=Algoriphagus sp. 4150 TaxID=2817756 RepID=UPI00286793C4|nr:hypothetical protein [Algoriphagus sp. 4150]MDR7129009.1 hypothetical protein [Algoriphagus sp. 4150]